MFPEISARWSLLWAKLQIPVSRQGGREMSAPRPYVTDPFHPLSSVQGNQQFLYICHNVLDISSMWYVQVCIFVNCACALVETLSPRFGAIEEVFQTIRAGVYWHKIDGICICRTNENRHFRLFRKMAKNVRFWAVNFKGQESQQIQVLWRCNVYWSTLHLYYICSIQKTALNVEN